MPLGGPTASGAGSKGGCTAGVAKDLPLERLKKKEGVSRWRVGKDLLLQLDGFPVFSLSKFKVSFSKVPTVEPDGEKVTVCDKNGREFKVQAATGAGYLIQDPHYTCQLYELDEQAAALVTARRGEAEEDEVTIREKHGREHMVQAATGAGSALAAASAGERLQGSGESSGSGGAGGLAHNDPIELKRLVKPTELKTRGDAKRLFKFSPMQKKGGDWYIGEEFLTKSGGLYVFARVDSISHTGGEVKATCSCPGLTRLSYVFEAATGEGADSSGFQCTAFSLAGWASTGCLAQPPQTKCVDEFVN